MLPLLLCTSTAGVHVPLLRRWVTLLENMDLNPLRTFLSAAIHRRERLFDRPLFGEPNSHDVNLEPAAELDLLLIGDTLCLDADSRSALASAVKRIEAVLRSGKDDEVHERSVREL
jgi:hypothetical protein